MTEPCSTFSAIPASANDQNLDWPLLGADARRNQIWHELYSLVPNSSAFLRPEVVRHQAHNTHTAQRPKLMGDECTEGRYAAVLWPKQLEMKILPRVWRKEMSAYRLVGDTLLAENPNAASRAFVNDLSELLYRGVPAIYFEDLQLHSALHKHLCETSNGVRFFELAPSQPHWYADVSSAKYWDKFSSKSRGTLGRKARRFTHQVRIHHSADDVVPFLKSAETVSTKSWQGRRLGLRVSCSESAIEDLIIHAKNGAFRSYTLLHGSVPVAFIRGFLHKEQFYLDELGYDLNYSASSPGTILLYQVLHDLIADSDVTVVDFGFGDAEYKQHFGTYATRSGPHLLTRKKCVTNAVCRLHRASSRVEVAAREITNNLGLGRLLRRAFRKP